MDKKEIYLPNGEVHIVEPESPINEKKITFTRPGGIAVSQWFEESERRKGIRAEVEDSYDYAKIEINSDRPVAIGISGDWHLGTYDCNYELLKRDIQIMSEHPLVAGSFLMGDLVSGSNFNPAQDEDILNWEEQRSHMEGILDYIGKDKIFGIWAGNHCRKWERKHGTSKYTGLSSKYEAPIFYGNAYVDLFVNDVNYKLLGSHRLRGNSIYNNAHPSARAHRETQGVDVAFCGHIHKKGKMEQTMKEFNGARKTYSVTTGTYQNSTEYGKDSGFPNQKPEEQGMYFLIFNHDKKLIRVQDTEQALETLGGYL